MKTFLWRLAGVAGSILILASISPARLAAQTKDTEKAKEANRESLKRASGFGAAPTAKPAGPGAKTSAPKPKAKPAEAAPADQPGEDSAEATGTLTAGPRKADRGQKISAEDKSASDKPSADKASEANPAESIPAAAASKPVLSAPENLNGFALKPVTWTLITAASDRSTTSPIRPPKKTKVPGGVIPISTDGTSELYLPAGWKSEGDGLDLLIHFHGAFWVVKQEAERVGVAQPLLMINPGGPGSRYEKMFKDPEALDDLLENALKALQKSKRAGEQAHWNRIYLSSFSAGYAAVREILLSPRHTDMIAGVALADSLHAAFDDRATSGSRAPRADQMRPFIEFAQMASKGQKIFVFSHSSILPEEYCGTPETAACLIAQLGGRETATVPPQTLYRGMKRISTFERGGFKVYGFAGSTGPDHMDHFYALGELFREFPLTQPPAAPGAPGKPGAILQDLNAPSTAPSAQVSAPKDGAPVAKTPRPPAAKPQAPAQAKRQAPKQKTQKSAGEK